MALRAVLQPLHRPGAQRFLSATAKAPSFATPQRLAQMLPSQLSEKQRHLYDSVVRGALDAHGKPLKTRVDPATGALLGPFNAMLLSPELGTCLNGLATTLRCGDLILSQRVVEVVVLFIVQRAGAKYPAWSHQYPAATIEALLRGARPDDLLADELAALDVCEDLLASPAGAVRDATYAGAIDALGGERGVFELLAVVGMYRTLAGIVNTFRVPVPPGEADPFPDTHN